MVFYSILAGAALHGHDTGMVSTEWLVKNATYRANLYVCTRINNALPLNLEIVSLLFAESLPTSNSCPSGSWYLVADLRNNNDPEEVDRWFTQQFTLVTDNPEGKSSISF
jgi:adenosine deaminase CECR1